MQRGRRRRLCRTGFGVDSPYFAPYFLLSELTLLEVLLPPEVSGVCVRKANGMVHERPREIKEGTRKTGNLWRTRLIALISGLIIIIDTSTNWTVTTAVTAAVEHSRSGFGYGPK